MFSFDVGDEDFDQKVIDQSHTTPVVVDFWAPWCGPCRMLGPVLEQLAEEFQGKFLLAKLDVDQAQETAARFSISSIPAVKAFRQGSLHREFLGVLPENQLREFLGEVIPNEADLLAQQAGRIEDSDARASEQHYRKVLQSDPGHEQAKVGLARLLIGKGAHEEARQILENFAPSGELKAEAERLNGIVFLRQLAADFDPANSGDSTAEGLYRSGCLKAASGNYEQALADLLKAAHSDKVLARDKIKQVMVQIFYVVGVRSDLADSYRSQLSRLLY